jgi:hypothetical protein
VCVGVRISPRSLKFFPHGWAERCKLREFITEIQCSFPSKGEKEKKDNREQRSCVHAQVSGKSWEDSDGRTGGRRRQHQILFKGRVGSSVFFFSFLSGLVKRPLCHDRCELVVKALALNSRSRKIGPSPMQLTYLPTNN